MVESSSHNHSSPEITLKEELVTLDKPESPNLFLPADHIEFSFDQIAFTTNNEVALLYPSHRNSEYFMEVSDFISKCCLKEAFTRAPTQYKEYLCEFWYTVKTLDDSKIWVSTPTGRIRGDIGYSGEIRAKGTLKKSCLPPRWRLLMGQIIQCFGGKTDGLDQISNKDATILYCMANRVKASKSKTGQSEKETQSSLAKDKSPSHPSPPTPVVGEMHKEAQQAVGGLTSLGSTSEERSTLSPVVILQLKLILYYLLLMIPCLLKENKVGGLLDLLKDTRYAFFTPDSPQDEPIIVSNECEEEETKKDEDAHATSHNIHEDTSFTHPPSPKSVEIQKLMAQITVPRGKGPPSPSPAPPPEPLVNGGQRWPTTGRVNDWVGLPRVTTGVVPRVTTGVVPRVTTGVVPRVTTGVVPRVTTGVVPRGKWMDDPNIIMEEYIRLDEEKARKHGKVFNWETSKYGKIWYNEDIYDLRSVKTKFPAIAFNDGLSSEKTLSCELAVSSLNNEIDFKISFDDSDDKDYTVIFDKNSFSYKIISTNDLKTDSENDNEKVNMPSLPPPEPRVSCFDDLDFFKDFKNEFSAIVYNDAPTSKSDLLTELILSPQHIDEFDLKDETSLSEYNEEEQNVLYFNDLFPFNIIYPDDLKSDKDNNEDKIDIKQSWGEFNNNDDGAYAHGSNKLWKQVMIHLINFQN
ncbi:hypothetical protein Tco_0924544 [Tanacetum coccineum]|uniref:Uncharacterized protein n=1 Tax=Tanacetum coccineum TaxID=301880 RepID=A0ABQ5D495_9ASTR